MDSARLTILLSGEIAGVPHQGGATWAVLQYLLGFRRLGHQVYFIEPITPEALVPAHTPLGQSRNADYFRRVMEEYDLTDIAALLLVGTEETVGLPYPELRRLTRRADLLVNIAGLLQDERLVRTIPNRVYLDLDPAFTQLWQAVEGIDMRLGEHTHFVTVGLSVGQPDCPVPDCGRDWIPTLQPVVLDYWPPAGEFQVDAWTTVANWRGYGSIEHAGVFYGQKAHSLRAFYSLPQRTDERFQLALAIHPDETKDLEALANNGWEVVDPAQVACSPAAYQRFIAGSKGEFGIAKSGYVRPRCGWFSDRSVCYLASGRPVIAQETGFSSFLPTGDGLFAFETVEDVLSTIDRVQTDYPRHARAARSLAEEYFDSDKVLRRLLDLIGTGPSC